MAEFADMLLEMWLIMILLFYKGSGLEEIVHLYKTMAASMTTALPEPELEPETPAYDEFEPVASYPFLPACYTENSQLASVVTAHSC